MNWPSVWKMRAGRRRRSEGGVADTVEALHLRELQRRSIFSLSGGQKQLLAFGSVYAMGPEIFVLDEPTANLDQDAIARLHDQIAGLKRSGPHGGNRGAPALLSHRPDRPGTLPAGRGAGAYLHPGAILRPDRRESGRPWAWRTLIPADCTLSTVVPAGVKEGLSVEGLTCAYRKEPPVFQALSFSARPGEVVAITGPNGGGEDHPLPVPVRPDPGTGRADRTEWQAAEPKGAAEGGVLRHAG